MLKKYFLILITTIVVLLFIIIKINASNKIQSLELKNIEVMSIRENSPITCNAANGFCFITVPPIVGIHFSND